MAETGFSLLPRSRFAALLLTNPEIVCFLRMAIVRLEKHTPFRFSETGKRVDPPSTAVKRSCAVDEMDRHS